MITMVCPPAPFSLPLAIVTEAWYSHPPPKRGDHWLVELHWNCDDDENDDNDRNNKELMISRPDISICSCIVRVFIILPCTCSVFPFSECYLTGKPVWCLLSYPCCTVESNKANLWPLTAIAMRNALPHVKEQKSVWGLKSISEQGVPDTCWHWLPPTQALKS